MTFDLCAKETLPALKFHFSDDGKSSSRAAKPKTLPPQFLNDGDEGGEDEDADFDIQDFTSLFAAQIWPISLDFEYTYQDSNYKNMSPPVLLRRTSHWPPPVESVCLEP